MGKVDRELLSAFVTWDIQNWSKAIELWDRIVDWSRVDRCLEIGSAEGGLSLWLARKGKSVVCSDIKDATLVRKTHTQFGHSGSIEYRHVDARDMGMVEEFDLIVFKSVLGVIGRKNQPEMQRHALEQMRRALKPGGVLLFAENLIASPIHQRIRQRFVRWGDRWRYVRVSEMAEFLKDYDAVEMHTAGFLAAFGRTERQRAFLGRADRLVFDRLVPARWQYIVYGAARKATIH